MNLPKIRNLSFEGMTFGYGGAEKVFENITFEMPSAKMVWIRSPGGRGKSTLLRIMAGLIMPEDGHYKINNESVSDKSFEEFLPFRLNMGYGFDFGGLLNNKTLGENLLLPLEYHKRLDPEQAIERVEEAISHFGMDSVKDKRPFAVSGSMRKLTCVVRAFIHNPEIVFLDDPLTGLKQENLNDLIPYVEESFRSRGLRQVFFTSENPLLAQHFKADEVLISPDWFTTRAVA